MLSRISLFLLLSSSLVAAPAGTIGSEIDALIQRSPAVQRGHLGYQFVEVESGQILAERDSSQFFTPASNTKLYTTALALVRLGPDYKFHTELATRGSWTAGQETVSDLQLIGGGDPNLSGRLLPYTAHSIDTDPLAALRELAFKLAAAGVRQVNGDVTGVATRYPGDLYPDGWTVDDTLYGYGAPVSALTLNDNAISLAVSPSVAGELTQVALQPSTSHLIILNEVVTDPSNRAQIRITRTPGSNQVTLSGTIGTKADTWREDVSIEDPALFAAEALIDALEEQNITVRGVARSQYTEPRETLMSASGPARSSTETVLAVHDSVPLWEDLQVIHKVSQNLHAEMLLREVAHVTRGTGTLQAGRAERDGFLQEMGITREGSGVALDDGSGLARQDLTTPQSTVTLLRFMWQRRDRDIWLQSMPIGGIDGSLEHRFQRVNGAERVHAKTGSISHVNTLSGYLETNRHRWLAFSVMVNATTAPDAQIRSFIDQLCALFLHE